MFIFFFSERNRHPYTVSKDRTICVPGTHQTRTKCNVNSRLVESIVSTSKHNSKSITYSYQMLVGTDFTTITNVACC